MANIGCFRMIYPMVGYIPHFTVESFYFIRWNFSCKTLALNISHELAIVCSEFEIYLKFPFQTVEWLRSL